MTIKIKDFREVLSFYKDDLNLIDNIILKSSEGKAKLIQEITQNLVNSGGKRLRPILLIIATNLFQDKKVNLKSIENTNREEEILTKHYLASAVEMIHSATLLHDDVVDDSQIRRGKKTANSIWDNKAPILVGDYLFSLSFQLMVKSNNLKILELLAKTSSIIADGEVLQLENSTNIDLSIEKYFEIIFGKTAILFSACCEVGALLNNRSNPEINALKSFGKNLGMIFQITDDILDYTSNQNTLGKDIGNDFFEGKVTLPIIKTYQDANNDDKKLITKIFEENFLNAHKNLDNFSKIIELINKYQAIKKSQDIAISIAKEAQKNLEIFENNLFKEHLISILEYSYNRIF